MDALWGYAFCLLPPFLISISPGWRHYAFFMVVSILIWALVLGSAFTYRCGANCVAGFFVLPMATVGMIAFIGASILKPLSLIHSHRRAMRRAEKEGR